MALQTIDPNARRQRRRKPGPAQAGLFELDRLYAAPRPIQRIERSYSLARKMEVPITQGSTLLNVQQLAVTTNPTTVDLRLT